MGSKIKKIDLPDKWQIKMLKSIIDPNRSIRYGIVQPGDYDPNGRFMVRGQDYSFGWVNPDQLFKVSDEIEAKYKNARLKEGDLILTIVGAGTGNVSVVPSWLDGANCTQTTARIAIDTTLVNSNYCYQYLISDYGKKLTYKNIKGGAQPGLNCGDIEKYEILLPPLPEQRAIANILSTWDTAIQTTQALISQKEAEKKWLMQNLLTGKKRLTGFSGEWKEVNISTIFNPIKNINDGGDTHSIMTISSKLGLISQEDKFDRVIAGDSLKKYTLLVNGDFAYNKGNSKTYPMGCIYRLESKDSALVPFVYICFSPTDSVNGLFYKHWFLAHGLDRQLNKIITSGARGDGLLNVNTEDFFKLKVPYPTLEEQTAIAQVLQTADKEIELLLTKLEQQKLQKKGLMQVLLTGKVRLKNI
jgi:type I restriction enzyme S subunit